MKTFVHSPYIRLMKKILRLLLLAIVVLVAIVLFNTFTFKSKQVESTRTAVEVPTDISLLSQAISFQTISHKKGMIDDSAFVGFHNFLQSSFPLVHSMLAKETVNDYSIIYTWQGTDKSLEPLVLAGHMDVVPVEYSSQNEWEAKPFSGDVIDGHIYGRGTIDDKGSMIAIFQAVEQLLKKGFSPTRTILLCFGHDEEIGGETGGKVMADILAKRGIKAWMVLDEGGTLATGIVPGIDQTVALIGTSEKGYVSLEISADMPGGHSSMPEKSNALEAVNAAVYTLKSNPLPNRLTNPMEGFIAHVGPHLPFTQKMAFANTWLFKPLIFSVYEKSASGAALIHTTQTATVFNSGIKDNVVPNRAKAIVNYRLLPGDEPEGILKRAKEIIEDTNIRVVIYDSFGVPASPVSSYENEQFEYLSSVIRAVNTDVLVTPYLVLGATDGRYYYSISENVYRFSPIPLQSDDLKRIHGINERISLQGFQKSVSFYATFISNM